MDHKIILHAHSMVLISLNKKSCYATEISKNLDITFCHISKVLKDLRIWSFIKRIRFEGSKRYYYSLTKKGKQISDNLKKVYDGLVE